MKILLCVLLFVATQSMAADITVSQGDTVVITLSLEENTPGVYLKVFGQEYYPDCQGNIIVGVDVFEIQGKQDIFKCSLGVFCERFGVLNIVGSVDQRRISEDNKFNRALAEAPTKYPYLTITHPFGSPLNGDYGLLGLNSYFTAPRSSGRIHLGEDYDTCYAGKKKNRCKKPIYSINAGYIIWAGKAPGKLAGVTVVIYHGQGVFSMYMHLSRTEVKVGKYVEPGKLIAYSGNTGNARNVIPHLHFGMKVYHATVKPSDAIYRINEALSP